MLQRVKKALSSFARKDYEQTYYLSETIAKFGLLIAGVFAVYQFYQAQENERIERAMVYVDRFEQGDIAAARRTIRNGISPYYEQFASIGNAGISEEDRKDAIMLLVEEDEGDLVVALEETADFFEGVRLCINVELCERTVAIAYFCPNRSQDIWDNFSPFFVERRRNNPEFASALEWCALGAKEEA